MHHESHEGEKGTIINSLMDGVEDTFVALLMMDRTGLRQYMMTESPAVSVTLRMIGLGILRHEADGGINRPPLYGR